MVIGGPAAAIAAFLTASIVILGLMFCVATLVTFARERTIRSLRIATVNAKRYGGVLLIGVGIWFIALAMWADFFAEIFPV
jgi:hypothetical protein